MSARAYKILLSIFLVVAIAAGGVLGYYDARLEAAVNTDTSGLDTVSVDSNLISDDDVINILLVGSDHGAIKGDSGRSDSTMIATINLKTKELKLTSLMRDMYVEIPGHGHNKLNAAYAFGGVKLLYQTIAENFGIKIDKYCVVDFSTFEKVINKVGGVEIDIEEKEAEYLNTTNYISKKKYRNLKVGKQVLNGNQALGYARVRYVVSKKYGDGDFGRTGRQRAVLEAAYKALMEQNPTTILDIALDALSDVSTDMSAAYLKSLAKKVIDIGTTDIQQMRIPLEGTYAMGRAQSNMFVFFVNFEANKKAMQFFIFDKGKKEDWAKNYGGTSGVETFGYSASSTSSGSGSSDYESTSSTSSYSSTSSTSSSYSSGSSSGSGSSGGSGSQSTSSSTSSNSGSGSGSGTTSSTKATTAATTAATTISTTATE